MQDVKVFIDTNVLLYSYDLKDVTKRLTAQTWMSVLTRHGSAVINLQVVNEFTDVLIRRKWFETPQKIFAIADGFSRLGRNPIGLAELDLARRIHLAARFSWWDCLLLASALQLNCTHFLSEDLQDGQRIEGLTIVDPFAHTPDQILVSL